MFRPPLKQYLYGGVILLVIGFFGVPLAVCWFAIQTITRKIVQRLIRDEGGVVMEAEDEIWCPENENDTFYNEIYIKVKGIVTEEIIVQVLRERLLNDKRLFKLTYYERLVRTHRAWFPDLSFDISNHVHKHSPKVTENTIMETLSTYVTKRMPEGRPGWLTIIFNLENEDSVILVRVNHTIGDGISLLRMLLECLIDDPFKLGSNITPNRQTNQSKLRAAFSALADQPIILASLLKPLPYGEPFHTLESTGKIHLAISEPVPLKWVKGIKAKYLASVNDVIVTCIATALAKHIEAIPDYKLSSSCHGKSVREVYLATIAPAFIPGVIQGPLTLRNAIGVMTFDLPITPLMNVYDRLQQVKTIFDYLKRTLRPFSGYFTQLVLIKCLPKCLTRMAMNHMGKRQTALISNMPGPTKKIHISGFPIEELGYFVPGKGTIGLGMSVMSYNGSIRLAIQSDECVLAEPQKICEGFVEAVKQLTSECLTVKLEHDID